MARNRGFMGQVFIEEFTLNNLVEDDCFVVLGEIQSNSDSGKLKILVHKTFGEKSKISDENEYEPNKVYEIQLFQGVEWTDPEESPIEFRLKDSLSNNDIKPNQEIALIFQFGEIFALPYSEVLKEALEIFFDKEKFTILKLKVTENEEFALKVCENPYLSHVTLDTLLERGWARMEHFINHFSSEMSSSKFTDFLTSNCQSDNDRLLEDLMNHLLVNGNTKELEYYCRQLFDSQVIGFYSEMYLAKFIVFLARFDEQLTSNVAYLFQKCSAATRETIIAIMLNDFLDSSLPEKPKRMGDKLKEFLAVEEKGSKLKILDFNSNTENILRILLDDLQFNFPDYFKDLFLKLYHRDKNEKFKQLYFLAGNIEDFEK